MIFTLFSLARNGEISITTSLERVIMGKRQSTYRWIGGFWGCLVILVMNLKKL